MKERNIRARNITMQLTYRSFAQSFHKYFLLIGGWDMTKEKENECMKILYKNAIDIEPSHHSIVETLVSRLMSGGSLLYLQDQLGKKHLYKA